jgi:hypothetical protein
MRGRTETGEPLPMIQMYYKSLRNNRLAARISTLKLKRRREYIFLVCDIHVGLKFYFGFV